MKARILRVDNVFKLLLINGLVKNVTFPEVVSFLKSYTDETHYEGTKSWDEQYELSMNDFEGETLAVVTDNNQLIVYTPDLIKELLEYREIKYITADEYAAKYNKQPCIIRRFCSTGKMMGAISKGGIWLIPEDAEYPVKQRNRN